MNPAAAAVDVHADLDLRDSSHLVVPVDAQPRARQEAGAALRDRLRADGYLLVRGRLAGTARAELDAVGAAVADELVTSGVVADGSLRTCAPVPEIGDPRYLQLLRRVMAVEALHRLAYAEELVDLSRLIVGEDCIVVHPRKVIRFAHPHALDPSSTTQAHQDYTYVQGGADGITCWIPLGDVPRSRGGLAVLVGSSRQGVRPIGPTRHRRGSGPTLARAEDEGGWASTDYQAGDVLVMHGFTVHRALPNRSDRTRLSLDLRYRGVSQALSVPEMWPPHHPQIGEWSELARGWTSRAWLEVPPGTQVVGTRPARRGLQVPPSALMGTPAATLAAPEPSSPQG